jgi:hypothetical protein
MQTIRLRRPVWQQAATIPVFYKGDGPPVLLLHGYPRLTLPGTKWRRDSPSDSRSTYLICEDMDDVSLPAQDRHEARSKREEWLEKLTFSSLGLPADTFAEYVSKDNRIAEILERQSAEKHRHKWRQQDRKDNRQKVIGHIEGLIATELDNPLRTAASIEAAGLVEIVFPGVEGLHLPIGFKSQIAANPTAIEKLTPAWPDFIAALLDTVRADRAIDWSAPSDRRTWDGESPLYGRWMTRTKNGWSARRFVGGDGRSEDQLRLQMRLAYCSKAGDHRRCVAEVSRRIARVLNPVLKEFLPTFSTAFEGFC